MRDSGAVASKEVELSAGTVRYRDSGSGPPLVFVHGLLVDGTLWRKVTPLLEDRFRCVVPDWLELIDDSWTYVPEDRPERLAELIGEFVAGE